MIHIIYRYCRTENHKHRPAWYSKVVCFESMVEARRRLGNSKLILLADGSVAPDILKAMTGNDSLVRLHRSGNAESLLQGISIALTLPTDDLVYFVEDDYLHHEDALWKLRDACHDCPGDYFSLYDHPDRYLPPDHRRRDVRLRSNAVYVSRSHHWRTVESTCMTFAAKVRTLKDDLDILMAYTRPGHLPQSRLLFRHLQGLVAYSQRAIPRILLGPIPSLATHCEGPHLAPNIDWQGVAGGTTRAIDARANAMVAGGLEEW